MIDFLVSPYLLCVERVRSAEFAPFAEGPSPMVAARQRRLASVDG